MQRIPQKEMNSPAMSFGMNESTNVSQDPKEIQKRQEENQIMSSYYLLPPSTPITSKDGPSIVQRQYLDSVEKKGLYQNRVIDPSQRSIDTESHFLLGGQLTSSKEKASKQLSTPLFPSSPDMSRGQTILANPDLLSNLWTGYDTRVKKSVGPASGVNIDRFIPMVPCLEQNVQNTQHIIPEYWVRGGMDTRSIIRNIDYLQACGLKKVRNTDKVVAANS